MLGNAEEKLLETKRKFGFFVVEEGSMRRVHAVNFALNIPKARFVAIADSLEDSLENGRSTYDFLL